MRMGDDYTSELTEFGGSYLVPGTGNGPTRWGSVQGGHTWNHTPQHNTSRFQSSANCYEAEDVLYGGERYTGALPRPRSGLYYSPPGTSYTIVESTGPPTTTSGRPEAPHRGREYTNTHNQQYNQSTKTTPRGTTYVGASQPRITGSASSRSSTLGMIN